MTRYYALWRDRSGQNLWEGPFSSNVTARAFLNVVRDKPGGSIITATIPMTPGERLEALPLLEEEDPGANPPSCLNDGHAASCGHLVTGTITWPDGSTGHSPEGKRRKS